jgi:hypothetical protein
MAYITQSIDMDIEVDEFVDACSSREIEELIKYLQSEGHLVGSAPTDDMNALDHEWAQVINKISGRARLVLTNEEEETIRKIANRL